MQKNITAKRLNYSWAVALLALSAFAMGGAIFKTPGPFAKIENFRVVRDRIVNAKIVEGTFIHLTRLPSKYYELHINVRSGQTFYLRSPERAQLAHYLDGLPIGEEVSIRFCNDSGGHQILDLRNDKQIFIPFSDIVAEANQTRHWLLGFAGVFLFLGTIAAVKAKRNRA